MEERVVEQIQRLLLYLDENRGRLVVDADVYATDLSAASVGIAAVNSKNVSEISTTFSEKFEENPAVRPVSAVELIREMDVAQVDAAVVWPNPATIRFTDDAAANERALLAANRYVSEIACRYPERFIPGGWTGAAALGIDRALALPETLVTELGFAFLRLSLSRLRLAVDSEPVLKLIDRIVELGATPVMEFSPGSPLTTVDGLERVLLRHPRSAIVVVHTDDCMAARGGVEAARRAIRELGLRYANLKQVLSARPDTHVEADVIEHQLAGAPFGRNLMCASGAPFGRMTWRYGGYRAMLQSLCEGLNHTDERIRSNPSLFDGASVRGYLGANCVELVLEAYLRVIETHGVRVPPAESSPEGIN